MIVFDSDTEDYNQGRRYLLRNIGPVLSSNDNLEDLASSTGRREESNGLLLGVCLPEKFDLIRVLIGTKAQLTSFIWK